jgi:hypothetical protein
LIIFFNYLPIHSVVFEKMSANSSEDIVDYRATCNELEWQTLPSAPVDKENRCLTTSFKTALFEVQHQ